MRNRQATTLVFALGLVISLVAGCGSTQSSPTSGPVQDTTSNGGGKTPIKIAAIDPLSGSAPEYGLFLQKGQYVARKLINDAGGILGGHPIDLIFYDDQNIPENGVSLAKRAIEQDHVKFIAGTNGSNVALAIRDVTEPAKVIYMVGTSKGPTVTDPKYRYLFRMNSSTSMDADFFYKFIAEKIKPKKVAIIAEQTDFGQGLVNSLKKAWSAPGSPQIVDTEYAQLTATDFSVQLTKIKAAQPDALFMANGGSIRAEAATLKQAAQLGLKATIIIPPGCYSDQLPFLAGKDAVEGAIYANIYDSSIDNEFNKKFVETYKAMWNELPNQQAVNGFETIWILAKAIDKAGTDTDTTKIAETIRNNKWETPRGMVWFDDRGQAYQESGLIPFVVKDGKLQVMK